MTKRNWRPSSRRGFVILKVKRICNSNPSSCPTSSSNIATAYGNLSASNNNNNALSNNNTFRILREKNSQQPLTNYNHNNNQSRQYCLSNQFVHNKAYASSGLTSVLKTAKQQGYQQQQQQQHHHQQAQELTESMFFYPQFLELLNSNNPLTKFMLNNSLINNEADENLNHPLPVNQQYTPQQQQKDYLQHNHYYSNNYINTENLHYNNAYIQSQKVTTRAPKSVRFVDLSQKSTQQKGWSTGKGNTTSPGSNRSTCTPNSTDKKVYQCIDCLHTYYSQSNLNRHRRKKHMHRYKV
eukprot:Nk52_evm1s1377 gene=Nk52_evmTU1s1377